jgi:DNA mismatch repair protein MutS
MTSKQEQSVISEYIQYTELHQGEYGKKTVVLMQVGAFFEVYGLKDSAGTIHRTPIYAFSQACNLNISEKKITMGEFQVVMAGFRDYTLDKYLAKLTESGFTAVVYTQEKTKDGKSFRRTKHSIHSAGTYLSYDIESSRPTNHIMCIWLDVFQPIGSIRGMDPATKSRHSYTRETLVYGLSVVNIFSGQSTIFEYQTPFYMNPTTFDELERYVSIYQPSEVLVVSPFEESVVQTILQYSGIRSSKIHLIYFDTKCKDSKIDTKIDPKKDLKTHLKPVKSEIVANCTKQKYIQHMLSAFYGEESYEICSEFHTHPVATQSFCYLLHFIQEHNPELVRKISIPEFNNTSDRLLLANHTLKQLNIIDDASILGSDSAGTYSSVLTFLNRCVTSMGKRLFQTHLLNPTYNQAWLNREYQNTSILLKSKYFSNMSALRKKLGNIRDLDKIGRQIVAQKIYPASIYHLYIAIQQIRDIHGSLSESGDLASLCESMYSGGSLMNICDNMLRFIESRLILENCKTTNTIQSFDENIIQLGYSETLDKIIYSQEINLQKINEIHAYLNKCVREYESGAGINETEYVKIHETEKSGISFQITKKRSILLKTVLGNLVNKEGALVVSDKIRIQYADIKWVAPSTNLVTIDIPLVKELRDELVQGKEEWNKEIEKEYRRFLVQFETEWFQDLEKISKYIAKIDVLFCKAYLANEYKYCEPNIIDTTESSFVDAKDMRHCLIEHIQQREIYVTNDIILDSEQRGILLYGTNAVGKTSLIRALGICIIMAQAGLYVPCSQFQYKPYRSIFSRILGNDNLFKGLSTFAVEMSELRVILKTADEYSLILGDELCSGTETESALSIFMAGIMELHKRKASCLLATHFHELVHYDEMKSLDTVRTMHMAVTFDLEQDCLIYDRKLRDGPGNRMYGLEVCKSLYLPDDFLENAYAIRNKYYSDVSVSLSHPTTVYNANKIRGVCEVCDAALGSEIHHITPQKDADANGYIGSFHKNHPANLLSVCEKCHHSFHDSTTINTTKIVRKKTTRGYKVLDGT